jgi:coenzyme A diphosphatase NUDT7
MPFLRMAVLADQIRRAGDMRTYAQDTALPGGKYEEGDVDAEGTAVSQLQFLFPL